MAHDKNNDQPLELGVKLCTPLDAEQYEMCKHYPKGTRVVLGLQPGEFGAKVLPLTEQSPHRWDIQRLNKAFCDFFGICRETGQGQDYWIATIEVIAPDKNKHKSSGFMFFELIAKSIVEDGVVRVEPNIFSS